MKAGERVRIIENPGDPSEKVGKEGVYIGLWRDSDGLHHPNIIYPHVVNIDGEETPFRLCELEAVTDVPSQGS